MSVAARDLASIARHVVALLRAKQVEEARRVLAEAQACKSQASLEGRQTAIAGINRSLLEAKRAREQVLNEIEGLPPDLRLDARHRVQPLLDELFNGELSELRDRKRALARPPNGR